MLKSDFAISTMYVLLYNVGSDNEGIHTLTITHNKPLIVLLFEDLEDAQFYSFVLSAQNFPRPSVENVNIHDMVVFCEEFGYECRRVKAGDQALVVVGASRQEIFSNFTNHPLMRKSTFPKCPKCRKDGSWAGHKDCSEPKGEKGKLWVHLPSGREICDSCLKYWEIQDSTHYCSCGAKFEGGEIWQGMTTEIALFENYAWLRKSGIIKGSMKTRFIGWHK
jgi:hypothetical protein